MVNNYEKNLLERYLKPVEIENKEFYYSLIYEISESLTSGIIVDLFHSNKINMIITEACQSLANSIRLYELGYFDDAYYSMRSAIELATIMLDVGDNEYEKMVNNMNLFSNKEYRNFRASTLRYLKENGIEFRDVANKMPNFVNEINNTCIKLNSFVHKTGFDNFYGIRNYYNENFHKKQLDDFENNLISSIRIVAIMRLVIDPFPLLLADEEIYYRSPNIMTYPFNEKLLEVMGEESIAEFKNTDVYKSYEEELMKLEKRNQEVNNIVMADYIDLDNLENIYLQKHLLNHHELKYVDIASCSEKIILIISDNGFSRYSTSSNTHEILCNHTDINLKDSSENFNIKYDSIYVSILQHSKDKISEFTGRINYIYIFHLTRFNKIEINKLNSVKL
ncbi:hypothetical protein [Methanobrevibacter smithii]|jgi:hypothetical protein|uniref:hypothetical protein n=1 Tax=Methanobrevibacter smithii TaxID=2173 RepID=UPI001C0367D8|nr:hypothetical protein [Methanobrevibacter smithii]MBT9658087.1 hypothetical protein [Methanobrevibacter smithii]